MRIAFRVDASDIIGSGHVMRCRTLAAVLRQRGAEVSFICRAHGGHLLTVLEQDGFPTHVLPNPDAASRPSTSDYAGWLGVTETVDAAQTITAFSHQRVNWLVVDHYALSRDWEIALRPHADKIMAIDDIARAHDVDVILDQNFSAEATRRYTGSFGKLLLGPAYALLRPEYAALQGPRPRLSEVRRIFVFFGGADPDNITGRTLSVLSRPEFAGIAVDVVAGSANPHLKTIQRLADARQETALYVQQPTLAPFLAKADLALGGGGVATWERCALGVPALIVSIAENQEPACRALADAGIVTYLGRHQDLSDDALALGVKALIDDHTRRAHYSENSRTLVDGLGALRVAEAMVPTPRANIQFLGNATGATATASGLPVGTVRLDDTDGTAKIHCTLDPVIAGRGWDAYIIARAARAREAARPRPLVGPCPAASFLTLPDAATGGLSICILSDRTSWLNDFLPDLIHGWMHEGHRVLWAHEIGELRPAELCFYLSCGQLVKADVRAQYAANLVVHESALPQGRGWSPLSWQILEGRNEITVTLFEAQDRIDSGTIYLQDFMTFDGHELVDELRVAQAEATFRLCRRFVNAYPGILKEGRPQSGEGSLYPRRRPADSRIDPSESLADHFPQLRIADNLRYPAFFDFHGQTYELAIRKRQTND